MNIALHDRLVTAVETGFVLRLRFDNGAELDVETTLELRSGVDCESGEPGSLNTDSLTDLSGRTVVMATIDDRGALTLSLTGDRSIVVKPDDAYEAWSIAGPGSYKLVCMPGGELAEWAGTGP